MLANPEQFKAYTGKNPYIFLSYSHEDEASKQELVGYLNRNGYNVWYDEGLIPAQDWDRTIAQKIKTCTFFIALVSKNSLTSRYCLDELRYAWANNRPCLLIFLENVALPEEIDIHFWNKRHLYRWEYSAVEDMLQLVKREPNFELCHDPKSEQKTKLDKANANKKPDWWKTHSWGLSLLAVALLAVCTIVISVIAISDGSVLPEHTNAPTPTLALSFNIPVKQSSPYGVALRNNLVLGIYYSDTAKKNIINETYYSRKDSEGNYATWYTNSVRKDILDGYALTYYYADGVLFFIEVDYKGSAIVTYYYWGSTLLCCHDLRYSGSSLCYAGSAEYDSLAREFGDLFTYAYAFTTYAYI